MIYREYLTMRRYLFVAVLLGGCLGLLPAEASAQYGQYAAASEGISYPTQHGFGRRWGGTWDMRDYQRFNHYPYVYYPHNFYGHEYYKSRNHPMHRYPPEMQIPVYNRQWFNYYPSARRYHRGHHFILDVF